MIVCITVLVSAVDKLLVKTNKKPLAPTCSADKVDPDKVTGTTLTVIEGCAEAVAVAAVTGAWALPVLVLLIVDVNALLPELAEVPNNDDVSRLDVTGLLPAPLLTVVLVK